VTFDGKLLDGVFVMHNWVRLYRSRPEILMEHGKSRPKRRPLDWASRSLQREFEEVIMVEVVIGEMFGSD
jgi:hypothetical protein